MSCRSRVAGFRKGWQRIKNNWDDFKVEASVEAPTTVIDLDYSKSGGIWDLNSTTQFPKTSDVGSGPVVSDVTPNAVNWNNLSTVSSSATTNTQTITGIDTTITLEVSFTRNRDNYTLRPIVNGSFAGNEVSAPGSFTLTVSNNDTVAFTASGGETRNSSATVVNVSDNNTIIDTFNIDLQN